MTMTMATIGGRRGVATCLGVALSLLVLAGCGDRKTADEYTNSGEAHLQAGDVRAAIIDLKNALQKDSKSVRARLLLGQAYVEMSDSVNGEVELLRARDEGAPAINLAKPLALAQLRQRKLSDALKTTEAPDGASSALKASLLAIRAQALAGLGRRDDASAALEQGLAEDPHSADVLSALARFALGKGDRATAKARLEEAQKEAPKDPNLMELEGDIDFFSGDFSRSEQAYQRMLEAQPWNVLPKLGLARAQVAQSKLKEAIANLDVVLKSAPKDPQSNYLRGLAAYRSGDFSGALAFSQRTLSAAPNQLQAQLIAGAASYALKQYEQANSFLGPYVFRVPQDLRARKLLASTQMQLGHPGDAVKTLTPAISNSGEDAELLAMIGAAAARSGDTAMANEYLEKAVAKAPENSALRTELGLTDVALGKTDVGIEELEKAAKENPRAIRPEIALYLTYMRNKEYDKALEVSERLQKNFPEDPVGFNLAGIAYLGKGDLAAGKAALLKAHAMKPGDANADRNLAKLAIGEKKFDEARGYYQDALKADPKNVAVYLELAALEELAGHTEQAEAALKQAVQQTPDSPDPLIALARYYLGHGKSQEALATTEPALNRFGNAPAYLEVVGRAQLAVGHADNAVTTFKTLTDLIPQSAIAHEYLSEAYAGARRGDLALTEANTALKLEPNNDGAKFNVARLLFQAAHYDDARIAIDALKKDHPQDPNVAELEGMTALQQNRPVDAVAAFQRAIASRDNSSNRLFLATAQSRAGHVDESEKTLKPWIDAHPDDASAHMALGDIYLGSNKLLEAKEEYGAMLKLSPNSYVAENNYAWVLSQLGEPKEALAHARHAAELSPNSPEVLDTLGVVLLKNDDAAEAVDNLKKARQRASTSLPIQYHLAQALAGAGRKPEAVDMLRGLLAGNPEFKDRDQAEKMLHDLAGG